jgi:regulator of protease activity HflC (stomatin/prohibitin superfamily)
MGLNYQFNPAAGTVSSGTQRPVRNPLLDVPKAVVELVPESVARENMVFPISASGETVAVAARDATDILLADKLSFILTRKVRLIRYPEKYIRAALDHHYGRAETWSVDSMLMECAAPAVHAPRPVHPAMRAKSRGGSIADLTRSVRYQDYTDFDLDPDAAAQPPSPRGPGSDPTSFSPRSGMFRYTVPDGHRVIVTDRRGRTTVVVGPARFLAWGKTVQPMGHYVAHPGEFLVVRYRDGRQEHLPGPSEVWFDARTHLGVTKQDALQVAAKEAVVVYTRGEAGATRRVVHGPTLFVPAPGEWLHTFTWHGSDGGSTGTEKIAKGLVFQKLWLMPDQMYHDVREVRTADDAVLTIKLMIFFELLDIDRMLDATHDPIGDFVNAATSDVVDFTGRRTFEEFKKETSKLNEMDAYRQLVARAGQTGYRINKVVYRGYAAPDRLQAMHDQAIEARTKLELDRATEEQAQGLEDFKLNAQMQRAAKRRTEQATEAAAELELQRRRQDAELEQARRAAELQQEVRRQADARQREHLDSLKAMGVDLTAFLTQSRADRVIEFRGSGNGTHVHLDRLDGKE